MRSRILQLLAISGMLLFLSTRFGIDSRAAQNEPQYRGTSPNIERQSPPVLVDGATSPESISDDLAYHLFLSAIALPASASAENKRGRDGVLERIGLSREDARAFVSALANLREDLDGLSQERNRIGRSTDASMQIRTANEALKRREADIVASARARIERTVSGEGLVSLDEHIRTHVKRRIKIYGS
jgi:hypothetical protein